MTLTSQHTHHKAISIFDKAITKSAIPLEKPFQVSFTAVIVQTSNIHPRHVYTLLPSGKKGGEKNNNNNF